VKLSVRLLASSSAASPEALKDFPDDCVFVLLWVLVNRRRGWARILGPFDFVRLPRAGAAQRPWGGTRLPRLSGQGPSPGQQPVSFLPNRAFPVSGDSQSGTWACGGGRQPGEARPPPSPVRPGPDSCCGAESGSVTAHGFCVSSTWEPGRGVVRERERERERVRERENWITPDPGGNPGLSAGATLSSPVVWAASPQLPGGCSPLYPHTPRPWCAWLCPHWIEKHESVLEIIPY
jgi:hypothetical protein